LNDLKGLCNLQLNNISSVDNDPSLLKLTFSILDFNVSGNNQIVSKELAIEAAPSLKLKPLVCQYNETTDYQNQNDHFGSHGVIKKKNRYGKDIITTNSIVIGTSNETGGYLGTIKDNNGNETEVLMCDFYLWLDKYQDIANLINEMWEAGIPLKSSCEFVYKNYKVENGISYILSPLIFLAHCILKSNEHDLGVIEPAYDSSQLVSFNQRWNKAISQAVEEQQNYNHNSLNKDVDINILQKEENTLKENLFFKSLCELSHGDIRSQIMTELSKTMTADEFKYVFVSNWTIYDNYFVYENYEGDKYVTYKVNYSKTDTEVSIDLASKVKVERDFIWVEVKTMQTSVNELNVKIDELTTQLNTANETITTIKDEKQALEIKYNESANTIVTLNSKIDEMQPIVETYNTEQINKAINEKKEYYSTKFKAVNAVEKFDSEEVQNLIGLSINDNEEGKDAILSLNSILVDLVELKIDSTKNQEIKEFSSKQEKLIPIKTDFDSRYGFGN